VDLEFSNDQEELRTSVHAFLEKECSPQFVRSVVEGEADAGSLWAQMVELGWPALTIATEHGGVGLGAVELAIVCEELGQAIAPGPFLASATQFTSVVREVGGGDGRDSRLTALAAGDLTGTLAIAGPRGSWSPEHAGASATRTGDDWRLDGTAHWVAGGGDVDEIAVVALVGDGTGVFVVPADRVALTNAETLDITRRWGRATFDGVVVGPDAALGSPGGDSAALRRALQEATVALATETVGVCQAIFDVAIDHAKTRRQFGVPIGSFQALKHKFADMLVAIERARATCYVAALAIAEDDDRRAIMASMAKAAAGDCQRLVAQEGIQIMGGMGYTWEHDMHLYVKRAMANDGVFGTAAQHRQQVAELLLSPG
jgi:alkylation response protein AidB-like acyl-CoA dehydrogenase